MGFQADEWQGMNERYDPTHGHVRYDQGWDLRKTLIHRDAENFLHIGI